MFHLGKLSRQSEKAKVILQKNQYLPSFYKRNIHKKLSKICNSEKQADTDEDEEPEKKLIFLQYRGKVTENFERALKPINGPCKIITTIKKIKIFLRSLKAPVEKGMKSGLVYQIFCSRYQWCFVGQTTRHYTNPCQRASTHWYSCGKSFQRKWRNPDNG